MGVNKMETMPTIEQLYDAGYFSDLDYQFAQTLGRVAADENPVVMLTAALASRFTAQGHVCVDLDQMAGRPVITDTGETLPEIRWPEKTRWLEALMESGAVAQSATTAPLVVDRRNRLYLARYWQYQQRLVFQLRRRSRGRVSGIDSLVLEAGLKDLFPHRAAPSVPDHQRLAARTAVLRYLTVVSGGPGTGKTHTVVNILALIIAQAMATRQKMPIIELAAPTGKAAARLKEAITAAKGAPNRSVSPEAGKGAIAAAINTVPEDAVTLHRLLGASGSGGRFRHNLDNPLSADVLVVDEASMVDLSLMCRLMEAAAPETRVILLGDKDQLASVDAGAILGDICAAPNIQDCIVNLVHSYRFGPGSGIGRLAESIRSGDADDAMACLNNPGAADVSLIDGSTPGSLTNVLSPFIRRHYLPLITDVNPESRLGALGGFRILCAHRRGIFGSETLNDLAEAMLQGQTQLDGDLLWYSGRPVMIMENDYQLGLFNGDVGIAAKPDKDSPEIRVYFPDGTDGVRALAPSRLPAHQSVYAMTVHKSQGSEFDHVLLVLPPVRSPVITRELLYTAVTRAKQTVTIFGSELVIREAIATPVQRASGLSDQLR